MKQIATILILLFSLSLIQAQGIEFFHGDWEEALAKAKKEDKLIFVDAYTTWCGPCKRMAKQVFPVPQVGAFYNENFVNMKIDMEKPMGRKFQQKYPVAAFPTFYFIDGDGKAVHNIKGGQQVEQFISLGKTAMKKNDRSGDFEEAYNEGKRDYDLVYNYMSALNKAGKPSLKIANDYLKSQTDLTTPENLKFILEATTEADSKVFTMLTENRSAIEELTSKEVVADRIENACAKTVGKAIEYDYEALLTEASTKMKTHLPKQADLFTYKQEMRYFEAKQEPEKYLASANNLAKKVYKKNPKGLHNLAIELVQKHGKNKEALKQAEGYAKAATKYGEDIAYYFTHAQILKELGKSKDAVKVAEKAKKMSKGDEAKERAAQQLIDSFGT